MSSRILEEMGLIARGSSGYARYRSFVVQDGQSVLSLAGCADAILCMAIECLAVGMTDEGEELLAKCDQFLTAATERVRDEPIRDEMLCHFNHSQCRWLLGPPAVPPDLTRALQLLRENAASADSRDYLNVFEGALPLWLSVGAAEECVRAFEQFDAKYPPARRRHHGEAGMAYLLARDQLRPSMTEAERARLIDDFLIRNVPVFLEKGWYPLFAQWVKIVTQAEAGIAARAAIREIAVRYA
jgi:hypothetical protein